MMMSYCQWSHGKATVSLLFLKTGPTQRNRETGVTRVMAQNNNLKKERIQQHLDCVKEFVLTLFPAVL